MKKLAAVLVLVAAPLLLAGAPSGAADDDSTLNCKPGLDDNIHCTATDPDGIQRIRIVDNQTGALIKAIFPGCDTKRGFSFSDTGSGDYRVQILDCAGNVDTHQVNVNGAV